MEERFRQMINEIVMQCIMNNREEIIRIYNAADRKARRERMPSSPISIRAIMAECGMEYDPNLFRTGGRPADPPSQTDDIGDLPEGNTDAPVQTVRYDSLTFAKALVHMAQMEGRGLNMSQIQAILYIAYGVWMVTHEDRLFDEHPQAWQYGPVFPRVYSKLKKGMTDSQVQYLKLKEDSPERLSFLERCFRRYAWTRASDLSAPHVSSGTPWALTRRSNPDSPAVRIEDDLIREWFQPRVSPPEDD
jgi:uncharacterized phage-associated protein